VLSDTMEQAVSPEVVGYRPPGRGPPVFATPGWWRGLLSMWFPWSCTCALRVIQMDLCGAGRIV
jgi:hypothetical protein